MHCRLGNKTVAACFPKGQQPEFPTGEVPMGQYSDIKKKQEKKKSSQCQVILHLLAFVLLQVSVVWNTENWLRSTSTWGYILDLNILSITQGHLRQNTSNPVYDWEIGFTVLIRKWKTACILHQKSNFPRSSHPHDMNLWSFQGLLVQSEVLTKVWNTKSRN